jgi:hypothetical protein
MTRANADPAKNPRLFIAHGFEYQLPGERDTSDPNNTFYHRHRPGRDIFPALLREPFELWLVTRQPPSSTS